MIRKRDVEMKELSTSATTDGAYIIQRLRKFSNKMGMIFIEDSKRVKWIVGAIRFAIGIRSKLSTAMVFEILNIILKQRTMAHIRISSYLTKKENYVDVEIARLTAEGIIVIGSYTPEVEIYCYLLVLFFLIDQKLYDTAKSCSKDAIDRIERRSDLRTLDILAARVYFYYSLSHELTNSLSEIRSNLLRLHQLATLHHDEFSQETLFNLLLRNYLHYNLYDQAEKLISSAQRSGFHSNQQYYRYLFYLGKIRTIQLDYTNAEESFLHVSRKAPAAARGFNVVCTKWFIVVQLLLGKIPERIIFSKEGMKKALVPYFGLANAVRIGDLELLQTVTEKNSGIFRKDKTYNLIVRIRKNAIRIGLLNISTCYSRISLADVAKTLRLNSDDRMGDVESIILKAIRDGAIDAKIDLVNCWMLSKETVDVYSTSVPQFAFHSRIVYCLHLHNEAVKALRFPFKPKKVVKRVRKSIPVYRRTRFNRRLL